MAVEDVDQALRAGVLGVHGRVDREAVQQAEEPVCLEVNVLRRRPRGQEPLHPLFAGLPQRGVGLRAQSAQLGLDERLRGEGQPDLVLHLPLAVERQQLGEHDGGGLPRVVRHVDRGNHVAGTIYGTHAELAPAEILTWAGYNLVVYAVVPLLYFRRRYSARALCLCSSDRRNDLLVICAVLVLELAFQIVLLEPSIFGLPPRQLALGAALTFVLYLAGAVLPAMVFVYAILVPRFLKLTGSATTTVLLGGVTYAGLHLWDAWAVFTSPRAAVVSVIFLLFTYLGPGMIKTFLTLRTGNAWVHVWAYHALAPHTLVDTPHMVHTFGIR